MNNREAPAAASSPLTTLTVILVMTWVMLASLTWWSYRTYENTQGLEKRRSRIDELRGSIVHLDEVLTMSARMAAATGDLQWEKRYRVFEPQLDHVIKEAMALAPGAQSSEAAAETDAANAKLVKIENLALDLVRRGEAKKAKAVLFSDEYELQKRIYAAGMEKFTTGLADVVGTVQKQERQLCLLQTGAVLLLMPFLAVGWGVAFRAVRNWRSNLAKQAKELLEINESLDLKIAERTETLGKRVKELSCLHQIRNDVHENLDVESLCPRILDHLARAMQFPEAASPRIELGDRRFERDGGTTELEQGLHAEIEVAGKVAGRVSVYYPKEKTFVLPYEQDLVDTVAKILTQHIERERAETTLRESEAKYRLILDHSSDLIWNLSPEGVFTYVSPSWKGVTGYEPSLIVGKSFVPLVHPEDVPACWASFAKAIETKETTQSQDFRVLHADGSWRWHNTTGTPVIGPEGKVVSIVGVSRDITDRKGVEVALGESETRFRSLIENAPDAVFVQQAGRFVYLNPAACKLFGALRPEVLIGQDFMERIAPQFHDLIRHRIKFERETGSPAPLVEEEFLRLDGSPIPVETTAVMIRHGGQDANMVFVRDITSRKQAEEQLRESKQRLDVAMEGAEMGAWHLDIAEDKRYFCDRTCSLLGIDPATFQGTADEFFAVIPPEDRDAVRAALSQTLDHDRPYRVEYRTLRPDRTVRYITVRGKLTRDESGRPLKLSGFVWDVTAQKQAENDLRYTVVALESANKALEEFSQLAESATRAKSEFLANMSHEIRTPMTAILGYTDLLLTDEGIEKAPPHRREAFETIKRNGVHLLGLINDILDLSKVESGNLEIQRVRCSPSVLLTEVTGLIRVRAAEKSLPLKAEAIGLLPETVLTDPLRLRQVLMNLLGNAIKFTDHGEVRVAVQLVREGNLQRLRFDVSDTGIGMNDEQMSKLFKPFCQVDGSAARKFGGTGLGLAISKHLVEALGGAIQVRSAPGVGSTFSVTIDPGPLDGIPLIDDTAITAGAATSVVAVAPHANGYIKLQASVLLAEDGRDNRRLISLFLQKAGVEVTAVENGQLAYEAASIQRMVGRPFDVILMDMQMPVMDGYTATRQLRAEGYTGPIVALTAHAMASDRQTCLDAGCDDFATKPIDRQGLLSLIVRWAPSSPMNADAGSTKAQPCDDSTLPSTPVARPSTAAPTTQSNASVSSPTSLFYSRLATDPDIGELVDLFVEEMPERIDTLVALAKSSDWSELTRNAHQIKGTAGSLGFGQLTPYAARLEAVARDANQEEKILAALDELLSLCRRIRSGTPQTEDSVAPA